jgi:hypothetical protein
LLKKTRQWADYEKAAHSLEVQSAPSRVNDCGLAGPLTRQLAMLRRAKYIRFTSLQNAQLTGTRGVRIPKISSEKPS